MKKARSWLSDKVYIADSPIEGKGLFCKQPIKKDETIAIKGGHVIDKDYFDQLPEDCRHAALQISEHLYIAPLKKDEIEHVMVYVNHSCSPNVGLKGQLSTVAMRDIEPGEELTGDYCVAYSNSHFVFACNCKKENCRKYVKSDDWKDPKLQKKYAGYFCLYQQEKIDNIRAKK